MHITKRLTLAAGLLTASVPLPAAAQWYGAPAPRSPLAIEDQLVSRGFEPLGRPRLRGDVFVVEALDRRGLRVRLVLDAYDGGLLRRIRLEEPPPRWREPRVEIEDEDDFGPRRGIDDEAWLDDEFEERAAPRQRGDRYAARPEPRLDEAPRPPRLPREVRLPPERPREVSDAPAPDVAARLGPPDLPEVESTRRAPAELSPRAEGMVIPALPEAPPL